MRLAGNLRSALRMLARSPAYALTSIAVLALGQFIEALLFHVRARDPLTLALASASILLVSPLALFIPLRRATHVDCTVALREE